MKTARHSMRLSILYLVVYAHVLRVFIRSTDPAEHDEVIEENRRLRSKLDERRVSKAASTGCA